MIFRLILPFLFDFFRSNPSYSPINNESILIFKKNLNKEISLLIFKFFMGVVLTAFIIMSLVRLVSALSIYIGQFQNSPLIEIITFSVFTLIGCGTLVYLFVGDKIGQLKAEDEKPAASSEFDIQNIVYKFIDGVTRGFEKHAPSNTQANRPS